NQHRRRHCPITTDLSVENSQTIAFASPDVRHLPTMSWEGPPQPNMAHRKTAKAMITSRGLCRVKIRCMTAEILYTARTQSADCKLTTRFDTLKSFLLLFLLVKGNT